MRMHMHMHTCTRTCTHAHALGQALPAVAEPFGIVKLQHLERQPDFDLAHPGAS